MFNFKIKLYGDIAELSCQRMLIVVCFMTKSSRNINVFLTSSAN